MAESKRQLLVPSFPALSPNLEGWMTKRDGPPGCGKIGVPVILADMVSARNHSEPRRGAKAMAGAVGPWMVEEETWEVASPVSLQLKGD